MYVQYVQFWVTLLESSLPVENSLVQTKLVILIEEGGSCGDIFIDVTMAWDRLVLGYFQENLKTVKGKAQSKKMGSLCHISEFIILMGQGLSRYILSLF